MDIIRLAGVQKLVPLSAIRPYEVNNKIHTSERIDQMVEAIKSGYDQPITLDVNNVIIKGHRRYFACKRMKAIQVEVLIRDDLDGEAVRISRILDNTIVNDEWSIDNLMDELKDLKSSGAIGNLLEVGLTESDAIELLGEDNTQELLDLIDVETEAESGELLKNLDLGLDVQLENLEHNTPVDSLSSGVNSKEPDVPVGDDEPQVNLNMKEHTDFDTIKPLTLNMTVYQRQELLQAVSVVQKIVNGSNLVDTIVKALKEVRDTYDAE